MFIDTFSSCLLLLDSGGRGWHTDRGEPIRTRVISIIMRGVQKTMGVGGRGLSLKLRGLIALPNGGFFLRCRVEWEWRYVERIFHIFLLPKDAAWAKACMGERA